MYQCLRTAEHQDMLDYMRTIKSQFKTSETTGHSQMVTYVMVIQTVQFSLDQISARHDNVL